MNRCDMKAYYERRARQNSHHRLYFGPPNVDSLVYQQRMQIICRWTRRLAPASVLDVGCGEGFYIDWIARHTAAERLVGVDLSDGRLAKARHLVPRAEFHAADAAALPFADDSFDLVMCCEVLEHLLDPLVAMRELVRVSRRHVLISVPNVQADLQQVLSPPAGGEHPLDPSSGHLREYDPTMIRHLLRAVAVRLVEARSCGVYYRGRKRLFQWAPRRFRRSILPGVDRTVNAISPWFGQYTVVLASKPADEGRGEPM